jgi:hypothetical protein
MHVPTSRPTAPMRAGPPVDSAQRGCPEEEAAERWGSQVAALFPPRDADADTRAAWLARSPWPEIVFASAL